jgi:hypothetical protein
LARAQRHAYTWYTRYQIDLLVRLSCSSRQEPNTLAAQTGTSLRDLMTRMGHDSPRAALKPAEDTEDGDEGTAGVPVPVS